VTIITTIIIIIYHDARNCLRHGSSSLAKNTYLLTILSISADGDLVGGLNDDIA